MSTIEFTRKCCTWSIAMHASWPGQSVIAFCRWKEHSYEGDNSQWVTRVSVPLWTISASKFARYTIKSNHTQTS